MAISGGACSAYRCEIDGKELIVSPTTTLAKQCIELDAAIPMLLTGESVVLDGNDMPALQRRAMTAGYKISNAATRAYANR